MSRLLRVAGANVAGVIEPGVIEPGVMVAFGVTDIWERR